MTEFDVSSFLASFFDEASMRLQSINLKLVLLESADLDEQGLILLRRDIHTIKGSAQMLGVQDISDVSHLFEDALELTTGQTAADSQALIQFLFGLHDALQGRVKHADEGTQLDTTSMSETFKQLKQSMKQSADKSKVSDEQKPADQAKKRVRRKRPKIPQNIIAAVMGSIEGSLQGSVNKEAETAVADVDSDAEIPQPPQLIDFRPDVTMLGTDDGKADKDSGNFLRIDQTRLNRLSNQIIELGSGRYRDELPEKQLQDMVLGFRKLKDKIVSDIGLQSSALAGWQADFDRQLRQLQLNNKILRQQQQRSSAMLDDLRDQVLGLLLKPMDSVFSLFPRTVRNISKRSGKKVQLLVAGDNIEMDQLAAEALSEPLVHLINNAVAHGIESPEERLQLGKPEEGQITITAAQKGSDIHIVVTDDGKGLDLEKIRHTAIASGLISATEADEMDASEMLELIFHPGFSTQQQVNDMAGRGMGMSIILDVVRELTGTIHIQSRQGEGSQFTLAIPISLAVQKAMIFRIAEQRFGMLEHLIKQVVPLQTQDIKKGHGPYSKGYIDFEQHRVPIIDLRLSLSGKDKQPADADSVLIVEHLEGFLGIVVNEIMPEMEMMVREIDPYLKQYQPVGLMGCTIIEDGSVLLLIEPNGLKEMWRTAPDPVLAAEGIAVSSKFNQRVMLVDDSSIALHIEKSMFESMGFTVDTAIGGKDALDKIDFHTYDLLVTDLEMPDMDGVQLIQTLRNQEKYKELPILIIATRDAEDEQYRAINAGANAYLVKQHLKSDEEQLLHILPKLLGIDDIAAD